MKRRNVIRLALSLAAMGVSGMTAMPAANAAPAGSAVPAISGSQLWAQEYGGFSQSAASAEAVSPGGGTVFVTGSTTGSNTGGDYLTVAYDAVTGTKLWARSYSGPGDNADWATAIAVSPSGGTVFVTGASYGGSATGYNYATIAYNAVTGAQLWVQRYNGPGNGYDEATSVAVNPGGGTVYVTGVDYSGTTTGQDYETIAYNAATGARVWASRYNGPASKADDAFSVAVSPGGGTVFVTGASAGTTSSQDYATVAYNASTGARQWVSRYNGTGNLSDYARAVTVGPGGGTVFVTGYSVGSTSGLDYATVAYSASTGTQLWAKRYNGPGNSADWAYSVAVSPGGGKVFVTGKSTGSASGYDYATIAYGAATGSQLWTARYNGPANGADVAYSVAVSPGGGTVYVTGQGTVQLGTTATTVAYNSTTGGRVWSRSYSSGLLVSSAAAMAVAVNHVTGAVYVTGSAQNSISKVNALTIAYSG